MVDIVQKVNVKIPGLKAGVEILNQELRFAGSRIAVYVQGKVRDKQRNDTGEERRRTVYRISQAGSFLSVSVFNTVVQGLVDETGAVFKDKMPPWRAGSNLYAWVQRKGISRSYDPRERRYIASFYRTEARRAGASQEEALHAGRAGLKDAVDEEVRKAESTTFAIAKSIQRRGLPRPGDALRKPFETTRKQERANIFRMVEVAVQNAATRINAGKK